MKYLLIFLISFNVAAQTATSTPESATSTPEVIELTPEEIAAAALRVEKLAVRGRLSLSNFRMRMFKCGYNIPNAALFKKKIVRKLDYTKLECLESKGVEILSEIDAENTKQNKIKSARIYMKTYNCEELAGPYKAMCILLKR